MADPSTRSRQPDEIDGFRIQRILGTGGMATVYAALQQQPRRTVALKVIKKGLDSRSAQHRFKREVEILGRLRHPNIAQVFSAGTYDNGTGPAPYFVMEYIPGAKTIIEFAESRDLPTKDRLKLFVRACAAVDHGHKSKVIHRDLKPSNILVDEHGVTKVIDFGIARSIDASADDRTVQTEAGDLIGTIHYMAPEQLRSEPIDLDARCDVYALGAVLYKLLTGKPPYQLTGLPLPTAALVVMEDEPVPPSLYRPDLRGDLETILLKSLEKDRERRYRSAGSLGRDVLRYLNDQPIHGRPIGFARRARLFLRRHRTAVIAGSVAAATVLIAGILVLGIQLRSSRLLREADQRMARELDALRASPAETTEQPEPSEPGPIVRRHRAFDAHAEPVTSLIFGGEPPRLCSGGADQRVSLWSLEGNRRTMTAHEHDAAIVGLHATAEMVLTSVARDGTMTRLDAPSQRLLGRRQLGAQAVHAAISADGETVVAACDDLTVRVWSIESDEIRTLRGTRGQFERVAIAAQGHLVAASSSGGSVYVWNESGKLLRRIDDAGAGVLALGFTSMPSRLVLVDAQGAGMIWPLDAEIDVGVPFAGRYAVAQAAGIDPFGGYAVIASDEYVATYDLVALERLGDTIPAPMGMAVIAVDATARHIAIGLEDGSIHVHSMLEDQ